MKIIISVTRTVPLSSQVVERSGVLVTERKKSQFSSADACQDLAKLVKGWGGVNVQVCCLM